MKLQTTNQHHENFSHILVMRERMQLSHIAWQISDEEKNTQNEENKPESFENASGHKVAQILIF